MNVALWIAAGFLAVLFLVGAISKLFIAKEKLAAHPAGGWTGDADAAFVKVIGVIELLASIGLILPAITKIAPMLVPLAATGVVLLMIGAMFIHLRRREVKLAVGNLIYLAMASFVAWGRFGPEAFVA